MKTKKNIILIFYFLVLLALSCSSYSSRQKSKFLSQDLKNQEAFRVFISKDDYLVEQVQFESQIERIPDKNGDKEKQKFFNKESTKINFRNFNLLGTVRVELNARGNPIKIDYKLGATPRTWQASKYFINDISRFRFSFPKTAKANGGNKYKFEVSYYWCISGNSSLTRDERRRKAIQYLRSQKIKR